MSHASLALTGVVIAAIAEVWYLKTIFWGETRPHRITWGVWTLIGILGVGASFQAGAHWGAFVTFFFLLETSLVFLISLIPKYGKSGGERYDYPLGALAIVAIIFWRVGHLSPNFAAIVAVVADACVLWFTVRESWHQPHTETITAWLVGAIAGAFGVVASSNYSFAAIAYPAYLVVGNLAVVEVLSISRALRLLGKKT